MSQLCLYPLIGTLITFLSKSANLDSPYVLQDGFFAYDSASIFLYFFFEYVKQTLVSLTTLSVLTKR